MQGRVFTGFTRVRVAEKKKRVQKRLKPNGIKPLRTDQKGKLGLFFFVLIREKSCKMQIYVLFRYTQTIIFVTFYKNLAYMNIFL